MKKFGATVSICNQIGQYVWKQDYHTKAFTVDTPMSVVLKWAGQFFHEHEPTINDITFSEVSEQDETDF